MSGTEKFQTAEVFERAYIVKLFHNTDLQKKYLPELLPSVFYDFKRRLLAMIMKLMHRYKIPITVENILVFQSSGNEKLENFIRHHKLDRLTEDEIYNIINDITVSSSPENFEEVRNVVLDAAMSRLTYEIASDMLYYNAISFNYYDKVIVSKAKGLLKFYNILKSKQQRTDNVYEETIKMINSDDEYIPTSSVELNKIIGGFTRRYVGSIIAKSSHGKSSWTDYNILANIVRSQVKKVIKITTEEDASTQIRRYVAMINKISLTDMRLKTRMVTQEEMTMVRKVLEGRLIIYDKVRKLKDIIELMDSVEADMIYIDHLQSIEYPGRGTALERMIGNIPELVNFQKSIAKRKNMAIINLSQVNDKEIQRSERMIKAPRYWDAYGSSVLYQASREFLALWYPYKDQEDATFAFETPADPSDIRIRVEKSSFTKVGNIHLRFIPEYNLFADVPKIKEKSDTKTNIKQEDLFG